MKDKGEDKSNLFARAEEFLQAFKKGAEFTEELLKENERLRFKTAKIEEEKDELRKVASTGGGDSTFLVKRIEELEQAREELIKRYNDVEEENKDFAQKYVEVQEENNNLANLYIASYQLHSTLDFREVLQIIQEIVINLIGAEEFCVLLMDDKAGQLIGVAFEGLDKSRFPAIKIGSGVIGTVARTGVPFFYEGGSEGRPADRQTPLVCIPLKIKETVIGAIVIYKLLKQKAQFTPLDHELFTLLANHAATSIFSAKLYSESERKLTTIQGFIELLTK
jgi:transcriptional regulator with GAF, ATPase, and Fis domain